MLLDRDRLDGALGAAVDAGIEGGADELRGPLHGWLVLACAGAAASARGIAGAPHAETLTRAARAGGEAILAPLDDALAALSARLEAPDRARAARAARVLLATAADDVAAFAQLDEAELGEARESGMPRGLRRARGAHSTPRALADAVASDGISALDGLGVDAAEAWILDPAAGGGALLLAAGRALVARAPAADRPSLRAAVATRLYGVERDVAAALVARAAIALWGAASGRVAPATDRQLLVGDVLASLEVEDLSRAADGRRVGSDDRKGQIGTSAGPHATEVADALVDAFFAVPPAERAREKALRCEVAAAAARGDQEAGAQLARWAAAGRARGAVHPGLAWSRRFDLAVLNPPFLGGKRIATVHGDAYAAWLAAREPRATGNADLAAHVLLATRRWLAPRSALSIVATNTLIEGATRHAALERMLDEGHVVASAWRSARWPGTASVNVVRVALARDAPANLQPRLDGAPVATVDAGLRAATPRPPPRPLLENAGLAFVGFFLRGEGFVLEDDEARRLLDRDPRNATCLRRYLVGEDVLRHPERHPRRWVIDFGARSLEEARQLPDLLDLVERRVRPTREALAPTGTNRAHRRDWWRFANARPELRHALAGRQRCIVAPRVAKHLAFATVQADLVFSEQLVVVACDAPALLGVLASWVHDAWARAHSSSLQSGLRYLPSRAFGTFPFPSPGEAVDGAARGLERTRDDAARALRVGLTTLRDRVDGETGGDPHVVRLREAHQALDQAVVDAFHWSDLRVPGRASCSAAERDAFEAEVVRRLADENQRRAARGDAAGSLV